MIRTSFKLGVIYLIFQFNLGAVNPCQSLRIHFKTFELPGVTEFRLPFHKRSFIARNKALLPTLQEIENSLLDSVYLTHADRLKEVKVIVYEIIQSRIEQTEKLLAFANYIANPTFHQFVLKIAQETELTEADQHFIRKKLRLIGRAKFEPDDPDPEDLNIIRPLLYQSVKTLREFAIVAQLGHVLGRKIKIQDMRKFRSANLAREVQTTMVDVIFQPSETELAWGKIQILDNPLHVKHPMWNWLIRDVKAYQTALAAAHMKNVSVQVFLPGGIESAAQKQLETMGIQVFAAP